MVKALCLSLSLLASPFAFAQGKLENSQPSPSQHDVGIVSGWKCIVGCDSSLSTPPIECPNAAWPFSIRRQEDRFAELERLREKRLITEQEYHQKKLDILSQF
jgi:hypothetical protein